MDLGQTIALVDGNLEGEQEQEGEETRGVLVLPHAAAGELVVDGPFDSNGEELRKLWEAANTNCGVAPFPTPVVIDGNDFRSTFGRRRRRRFTAGGLL